MQERVDDCCNVSLFPPPPYFPSDFHGHLAALAGTTGVFPLGRLVGRPPAYLSVRLLASLQVLTVFLDVHSISLPVCLSSSATVSHCDQRWKAELSFPLRHKVRTSGGLS